jgi:hypothetical protein
MPGATRPVQGGAYSGPGLSRVVRTRRELGVWLQHMVRREILQVHLRSR